MEGDFMLEEDAVGVYSAEDGFEPYDFDDYMDEDGEGDGGEVTEMRAGEEPAIEEEDEGENGEGESGVYQGLPMEVNDEFIRSMLRELGACGRSGTAAGRGEEPSPSPEFQIMTSAGIVPSPQIRLITGSDRKTSPLMTRFEYTRIIGLRAREIEVDQAANFDSKTLAQIKFLGMTNSLDIAEFELRDLSVPHPFVIFRPLVEGVFEVWPVRDLIIRDLK